VLRNGDEIFPAMLDAIATAEHTIDFLTFVYWQGDIGDQVARALADRARAGVRVRVLLDSYGCRPVNMDAIGVMQRSRVDLRWFRPLSRLQPWNVNHRTHRKVMIVDEEVAFTGGVGIADVWMGDARNEDEWRDTHFRIEGPAVDGLRAAFLDNWAETSPVLFEPGIDRFPDQPRPGTAIAQCVRGASEMGWSDVATLFRSLLQLAEHRVRITTAYFVPDDDVRTRLIDAADRGVQVEVLLPGPHADKRFVQVASEASYADLLDHGISISMFQPSMLHAKVMTVDGCVANLGSANLNRRSINLDEEINVVVIEPSLVDLLDRHFDDDLDRSIAIDPSRWDHRSLAQRALELAARPLRKVF